MKYVIETMICLLLLSANHTYAKVGEEYIRWANGNFDIPTIIKGINQIFDLQPFLDSKDEFERMAAVRRLGELKQQEAVDPLLEIFAKEPPKRGLDDFPIVKMEIIRTLGRVGGEKARSALLGILKNQWEKGPKIKDKKGFQIDRDFEPVVLLLLNELYRWSHDKDVFQEVKEIALSEDVAKLKFYTQPKGIGENAWKIYLKGDMTRKGIWDKKESAIYLLNIMEDLARKGFAGESLEFVKYKASEAVLEEHSEDTLSSLQKDLEEEFAKETQGKVGPLTGRSSELSTKIRYIKYILIKKSDKKKQKESEKSTTKSDQE